MIRVIAGRQLRLERYTQVIYLYYVDKTIRESPRQRRRNILPVEMSNGNVELFNWGAVAETRVTDLATELDDSVLDNKPSSPDQVTNSTITGYTEEVTVSGNTTVIAKSDTGAQRTSIGLELATEIGAGPITGKTNVKSGSGKSSRPIVDIATRTQDD